MKAWNKGTKTLQEAIIYFADPANCREYLVAQTLAKRRHLPALRKLQGCLSWRTTTAGSAAVTTCAAVHFEDWHDLRRFPHRNRQVASRHVAGCELQERHQLLRSCRGHRHHSEIRVVHGSQNPARLRYGTEGEGSPVTWKPTKPSSAARLATCTHRNGQRRITGTGGKDKTAVMGILERGQDGEPSKVRTAVVPNRKKDALQAEVRKHVEAGAALYTDALKSYEGLTEFRASSSGSCPGVREGTGSY